MKLFPKNNKMDINLKNIIIPYSVIKIKANRPPPYSMLKPETISDSPSAKSKGVRLDSAIHIVTHVNNNGKLKKQNHKFCWINFTFSNV